MIDNNDQQLYEQMINNYIKNDKKNITITIETSEISNPWSASLKKTTYKLNINPIEIRNIFRQFPIYLISKTHNIPTNIPMNAPIKFEFPKVPTIAFSGTFQLKISIPSLERIEIKTFKIPVTKKANVNLSKDLAELNWVPARKIIAKSMYEKKPVFRPNAP